MRRRLYRYEAESARLATQAAEEEATHAAEVARLQARIQVCRLPALLLVGVARVPNVRLGVQEAGKEQLLQDLILATAACAAAG